MAKLFPSKQTVVDHEGTTTIILSNVKILTATSDHLELPNAVDAGFLHTARGTSDPGFYLTTSGNQIAIDGATVGTEYLITSRHEGQLNFARGTNTRSSDNVK
jgi:hypothetical protein